MQSNKKIVLAPQKVLEANLAAELVVTVKADVPTDGRAALGGGFATMSTSGFATMSTSGFATM